MNNLEKDFVKYPEAFELKRLGYDEIGFGRFNNEGDLLIAHTEKYIISNGFDRSEFFTHAPTYSQAFRWFRESYKLGAIVAQFGWGIENEFGQIIHDITSGETVLCYEEAERACLKKLIEIVKEKQK
jgi:hypothetical protein